MAEKDGLTNLRIAGVSDFKYSNGLGVRSDWSIFATIISKTLDRMTPNQHREFYSKWVTNDFFRRQFYESSEFWWTSGSVLGMLLLGTSLVLVWNRKQAKFISQLERAKQKTELANLQLEKARHDAELANKTKSSFVANISHEIRTPMNGVLGMCELLRTTELDSKQHEYLKLATKSAKNLLSLINDILDFSKIEAGKLELEVQPFSLTRLLDEVHGVMKVQVLEKGLILVDARDEDLNDVYLGDAHRVRQILLNLISNAIKFTDRGEVRVRVFRGDLDAETKLLSSPPEPLELGATHLICFEVEDTGAGIKAEKIDKLFEPFDQGGREYHSDPRWYRIGIGDLQESGRTDGRFRLCHVDSRQGKRVQLYGSMKPDFSALIESVEADQSEAIEVKRILLAEDGVVNQKVAIGLLEKRGHHVDLAENGLQALQALEQNNYDVVLMDIQMPEMDGLTAVRRIREKETGTNTRQRVIALTAHAMTGDEERFIEAGMDDHLPKPFKPDDLYAAVEKPVINKATPVTEHVEKNQIPVLDATVALATTGGDQDLVRILLETCIEEGPKMIAAAKTAIQDKSWADARRSGHSMKSSFGAVGAMAAAASAKKLEFTDVDDADALSQAVELVETEFNRLRQQIES